MQPSWLNIQVKRKHALYTTKLQHIHHNISQNISLVEVATDLYYTR